MPWSGPTVTLGPLRALRRDHSATDRSAGTRLLQGLHDGSTSLAGLLLDTSDPAAGKLRVRDVLAALPELGPDRADRLMADLHIHRLRRLRTLRPAQRQRLIRLFPTP